MGIYSVVRSLSPWKGVSLFLLTLALIKALQGILRYRRMFKFYNNLPGDKDFHWLWGNLHKIRSKPTEERMKYFNDLMKKHKYFARFWQGSTQPNILVFHPDTVKILLKTSEPKPMRGAYQFAVPWLGEGLLIASGQRWARSRRLLTPAFHFDILKPYVDIYNSSADVLLSKLSSYCESGESFEVFSHISLCTLEVILKCAMSYEDDIQMKGETHPYMVAVNELSEMWFERGRNPLLFYDAVFYLTKTGRRFKKQCDFVHSVSEDLIAKRKQTLDQEGPANKKYLDFLDILLTARDQSGDGLTPLEIRNEVDTFLFEGHDTTASAISWILYSLAKDGGLQDKVQEEIDAVMDGKDEDFVSWSDLSELTYLGCVIKEGMRLHCPVPFVQRQVSQPTTIEDTTFPQGTIFTVHLINLHHNPDVWEEPWEYKPERFLPENMKDKDNYSFVPFSAGPRNCIGQHFALNEEKVLLARILHRYRLELDTSHPVKRRIAAVMRSENGIKIFAKPRDNH